MTVLLLKSAIDTRDGDGIVKSRVGISSPCLMVSKEKDLTEIPNGRDYDVIMVDEAQFVTMEQENQLCEISCEKPVLCFGLLTGFKQELFQGSKRLVELAESFEKIKTICACGKAANYNAREQVVIGGNESYKAVCKDCLRKLKKG